VFPVVLAFLISPEFGPSAANAALLHIKARRGNLSFTEKTIRAGEVPRGFRAALA
jgi:hypothetical protein